MRKTFFLPVLAVLLMAGPASAGDPCKDCPPCPDCPKGHASEEQSIGASKKLAAEAEREATVAEAAVPQVPQAGEGPGQPIAPAAAPASKDAPAA
jgi:hypothetical protein